MNVTTKITNRKDKDPQMKTNVEEEEQKIEADTNSTTPYRFGPRPRFSGHRTWITEVLILGVLAYVWYTSKDGKETSLAKQKEVMIKRGQKLDCHPSFLKEIKQFSGCVPTKCGRYISDKLVTVNEVETLLNLAKRGIALGRSSGGVSILELHSGALSYGEKYTSVYILPTKVVTPADLAIYKIVKNKIQHAIAEYFGIDKNILYLTHPTFFFKLYDEEPKTIYDKYWRIQVNKLSYGSFYYSSLLYLSDFNIDFKGGRFIFVDSMEKPKRNVTVEPRKGRVLMFTSGAENPHFVEKVSDGERYAITVPFTCDKSKAISDPVLPN